MIGLREIVWLYAAVAGAALAFALAHRFGRAAAVAALPVGLVAGTAVGFLFSAAEEFVGEKLLHARASRRVAVWSGWYGLYLTLWLCGVAVAIVAALWLRPHHRHGA